MRLDNISHLCSIKFRVCMEHLWHDFISTQSFLFFFLFLVLHIFFYSFLKCYKSSSSCVYMSNSLFYSRRIIIHGPRTSCLQSRQIHLSLLEKKNIYSTEKSVKAISHIPVLSLVIEVQSSVLCTASKRFENITYLSSLFECALHTCLNKHVM